MDYLMGSVYDHISGYLGELVVAPKRGPTAATFPPSAVRSIALFFVLRATVFSPCSLGDARKTQLPFYRDEAGGVCRWTTAHMNKFVASLEFDFDETLGLLTSATLVCVALPATGLLCLACDETIIATDMKDVDSMSISRKPNDGFLLYTSALRLPLTKKPLLLRVLSSCCRTQDGVPIKENVKAKEVMEDVATFIDRLRTQQVVTPSIVVVMDAYFIHESAGEPPLLSLCKKSRLIEDNNYYLDKS